MWKLVDRKEAMDKIHGIVTGAIQYCRQQRDGSAGGAGSSRFTTAVMLALNLPGIGKTRMLYELLGVMKAQLRNEFGTQLVATVNVIFTFNNSIDNDVQAAVEPVTSIDALLGWRALRHHFAPDITITEFYMRWVIPARVAIYTGIWDCVCAVLRGFCTTDLSAKAGSGNR
jgi:hypothetical protein